MNYVYFQYFTFNKDYFVQYRVFDFKLNDVHFIKGIKGARIFIDIDKIHINIVINNQKKELIFTNVLFILNLFLNLIF